ncbi:hypothetical protein RB597_006130 [Gaeumannomyces tritici]
MSLVQAGLVLIPLLWIAAWLRVLARNYRAARATGLPFVVCPYDPEGFVFALIQEPLRPVLRRLLPAAAFGVYELSLWGWEFRAKAAVHKRYGPAFVVVTTGLNRLVCADPAMAHAILARRKDFVHPDINLKTMGFLGSNIITNNDEAWSRQRRIVAPALNERVSPDVWKESIDQASSLAGLLCASDSTVETIAGLRVIAIDVLTRIAYGRHKPLTLALPSRDPSADMSYVDAIHLCTEQILLASFVPSWFLRLPFMPRLLRTVGVALERLPGLTRDMLDQERRRSSSAALVADETTTAGLNNSPEIIMSTLIRLSDQEKELTEKGTPDEKTSIAGGNRTSKSYLTEEEIAGNLFIFTAAGFDTTANTMAYAVTLLAACPEWQAWIQAEIDAVLGAPTPGAPGHELPVPDYATAFPKLTRCMAVMLVICVCVRACVCGTEPWQADNSGTIARNPPPLPGGDHGDARHRGDPGRAAWALVVTGLLLHPARPVRRPCQRNGPAYIPRELGVGRARVQPGALDPLRLGRARRAGRGARDPAARRLHALVRRPSRVPRPENVAGGVCGRDIDTVPQLQRPAGASGRRERAASEAAAVGPDAGQPCRADVADK